MAVGRHARAVGHEPEVRQRRRSASTATWVSSRASAAPRHAWTPAPKARWPRSRRRMSNRSGSAKRAGSRFAAPRSTTTSARGRDPVTAELDVLPGDPPGPLDRALPARRLLDRRGEEPRRPADRASSSGCRSSAQTVVAIRLTVVSVPGHEQQDGHRDQLRVAQEARPGRPPSTSVLTRSDVRAGPTARRDQLADVPAEGPPRRLALRDER